MFIKDKTKYLGLCG